MDIPFFYSELHIPSTVKGMNKCLFLVNEISSKFNFDFDKKLSLQTVLVEAVENAFMHGNKGDRNLYVRIRI